MDSRSYLIIAKDITGTTDIQFIELDYQNVIEGTNIYAGGMEKKGNYLYISVATQN